MIRMVAFLSRPHGYNALCGIILIMKIVFIADQEKTRFTSD